MGTHKDLEVWNMSMDFVVDLYKLTRDFPDEEKFGLVSQMRRSAVSIPSNIAEGAGRQGVKENIQFLYIALASITELDTQLILSQRLGFCDSSKEINGLGIIKSKLINFIKYLKNIKK
jgi:four helix bundle protein